MAHSLARRITLTLLRRMSGGRLELVEPDGSTLTFGDPESDLRATIEIHDDRFWSAALRASVGLGEAYRDDLWDTDDPVVLTRIGARNMPALDRWRRRFRPLLWLVDRTVRRVPRNRRRAARRHISAHYDMGNDLFALFLDDRMMYSSGVFPYPGASLSEAQEARLERVCRSLELGPDDHLLEIGTGWGGLAEYAASNYGCRVTTTTISKEQQEGALRRIADAGVEDRVEVLLEDYRDLTGRYDKLVSLEMIEAVGWQYFDTYFRRCSELLADDGLFFLQAIVCDDRVYELEKASRSFASALIFPGGCLPSVEVIQRCTAKVTDMATVWMDDISEHYSETLRHWRERFVANAGLAAAMGYDKSFRRLWTLWLAMSEGGFRERRIRDVQMLFSKPGRRPALRPAVEPAASASG
jgi:cyclopropane-fatty-acyl-phospholipid synthase